MEEVMARKFAHGSGGRNASGLRQMLHDRQRRLFGPRGRFSGWPSEFATALENGDDVLVESSILLQVCSFEGLPADQYGYGGSEYGKVFLLSDDNLTQWTAEDQAALDPEPDAHCKGGRMCSRCVP
jgi:hypothetical protein